MDSAAPSARPLRIAGVPEAFNEPFELATFPASLATPEFVPHPGGSGAMTKSLACGSVDAAILLTECAVAAAETRIPCGLRILRPLVTSSLTWGIVASSSRSTVTCVADLSSSDTVWGISRYGSGSHIMACILADNMGWRRDGSNSSMTFKVCGDFNGLRDAVRDGHCHAFMWEWFTTSPFVKQKEPALKFVGNVPTPWGCFCVAVKDSCDHRTERDVRLVMDAFLAAANNIYKPDKDGLSVKRIVDKHGMSAADASSWLSCVTYAAEGSAEMAAAEMDKAKQALKSCKVI